MLQYGKIGLHLDAHSRGSMTIGNAMESLVSGQQLQSPLGGTTISFFGPAYSAQEASNMLNNLSGNVSSTVKLQNHAADFVGSWIGLNSGTWGSIPKESNTIMQWINIFRDGVPTTHSCYGSMKPGCQGDYGTPVTKDINAKKNNFDYAKRANP